MAESRQGPFALRGRIVRRHRRPLAAAAALVALAALAPVGGDGRAQDRPPLPETAPQEATRVATGDGLQVLVFGHAELSRTVPVQADGSITYLPIGRIEAAGRSVDDLARLIAARLEEEYKLRSPRVSVAVESSGERAVYILGAVAAPGSHRLPQSRPLALTQLVALAGGFTPDADPGRIAVQHLGSASGGHEIVDLSSLEREGVTATVHHLADGDTVYVPRRATPGTISVLGQVAAPGSFTLREDEELTVLEAVALARGWTRLADRGDVVLLREGDGGRVRVPLDVDAIVEGQEPDLILTDGDILVVGERGW